MTKKANLPETGELLETPVEQVSDESVEVETTTPEEEVEPKYTLALPAEQKPTKTEKKPYGAPEIEIVTETETPKEEETVEKRDDVLKDEVKRLSKQLAPYKRPINIVITNQALPRTATRKIQRRKVKELVNM